MMSNIGVQVTDEKASAIIASVDTDGNGMVRSRTLSRRSPSRGGATAGRRWWLAPCCSCPRAAQVPPAPSAHTSRAHLHPLTRCRADEQIEFDEFVSIMASNMLKTDGADELERAFALFDVSAGENGRDAEMIDVKMVRQYMSSIGSRPMAEADLDKMMASLRPDADGRVPIAEFRRLDCWQLPEYEGASRSRNDLAARARTTDES